MNKFFFIFLLSLQALAQNATIQIESIYDEYEGVALVEALLRDGKTLEAENVLRNEVVSEFKTQILWAKIFNLKKDPRAALKSIQSISSVNDEVQIETLLAYYQLEKYDSCAAVRFKDQLKVSFPLIKLQVDCFIRTNQYEKAYQVLKQRTDIDSVDRKFDLLVSLGLFQQALDSAIQRSYDPSQVEIFLKWAESLPKNEKALFLEILRLRFPNQPRVQGAWAQSEYSAGRMISAASGFKIASFLDSSFFHIAAEVFRANRQFCQAQYLGSQIEEPKPHLKFKLSLAIDRGRFSEITGLSGPFLRSDLNEDQDLHYAMAFSFLKQGSLKKASYHRKFISREDLIQKNKKLFSEN